MKILFIGNHSVDFSTETHHRKTFEKLGHTVIQIQENKCSMAEILLHLNDDVDMLYWTHTHSWRIGTDDEVKRMFEYAKSIGVPTVGYHLDLWLGLEREKDLHNDSYWGIEHFFTVDKLMADYLNENTNTKGYYLPAGVFEDECYMAEPDTKRFPHPIIFTGSKGYHSEYPYRPQLIDWLHKTYGNAFAHYGGGGKPSLRGHDLNVLYASAKIVIGDTLCKNFDYPYYFSDRLFEVTGRGGFMIFPKIKGVEFMFDVDELALYNYGEFDKLEKDINHFLVNEEKREAMRLAAHNRTKSTHTYTHRLSHVIETIQKEIKNQFA